MKLQRLTIHNIASIEHAVVDFEAEPLSSSEVFLITGKTGAGKSTILDAICLALYANTPRFDNTKMQGETKDGNADITISDTRQLMRRNTGEAYVRLTFTGSNGIHYEAQWAVARARKSATGTLQRKDWSLVNLDTNHTISKDAEIKEEIKAAVGLDFKQFCRTTMLAQGEFTRFLNSKDDEKAEILEKITGVNIYSKIGRKIYDITLDKRRTVESAEQHIANIVTLSDKEIEARRATLSNLDEQLKVLNKTQEQDSTKVDWLRTDADLRVAKSNCEAALKQALDVIDSNEYKAKDQLCKQWKESIDVREWIRDMEEARNISSKQRNRLDALSREYTTLLEGQRHNEAEIADIVSTLDQTNDYIANEAAKASVYANAQAIKSLLESLDNNRNAIELSNKQLATDNALLNDTLLPALTKAEAKARAAKEALDKADCAIKSKEEAVAMLNLAQLRQSLAKANDLLHDITTAEERIALLQQTRSHRKEIGLRLEELRAAIDSKRENLAAMEQPINTAKLKMELHKETLDKQRDTVENFAKTLRLKLSVGDTCPVCRQTIASPLPIEADLEMLVRGLESAYNNAAMEYNGLIEAKLKLDAEINADDFALRRDKAAYDSDTSATAAEQQAREACKACGIETLDDNTVATLQSQRAQTVATIGELTATIKAGEAQELELRDLRQAFDKSRLELDALNTEVAKAEKNINDCRNRMSAEEAVAKTKRREIDLATDRVSELIASSEWSIDWQTSPIDFATALIEAATKYNKAASDKQELEARLKTAQVAHSNIASVIESIATSMPEWRGIEVMGSYRVDNLLAKANDIGTNTTAALTTLNAAEARYANNKHRIEVFLAENTSLTVERLEALNSYSSGAITAIETELNTLKNGAVAAKSLHDDAISKLDAHQHKRPELGEDETLEMLQARIEGRTETINEIHKTIGVTNQELDNDRAMKQQLGKLIAEAESKKSEYDKWARLNELIGDATGNKFRKIAQSYVLSSLIHSANGYMKSLTDRYTLKVDPGTFVISLEDAYQGFVSRAASTISGGESFLVSLSLALALSDIGQTLSVDTIFIDEGFGTLSGEPLQNAINTLRSLHTKAGRHVGIISHIEELKECIPVQIQVNQEGNNSSSQVEVVHI